MIHLERELESGGRIFWSAWPAFKGSGKKIGKRSTPPKPKTLQPWQAEGLEMVAEDGFEPTTFRL